MTHHHRHHTATVAPAKGADPHPYDPDKELPGYCRCGLIRRNGVHDLEAIARRRAELATAVDRAAEAQAEHQRRTGEAP